jgi:hypothetical protein
MHNVPGGKVVALRPDQTSTEVKALVGFLSPPLTYDRRDVRAQKELVAAALDGVGWETERVLADMWSSPGFFFDSISQVHLDRWSNGGWCCSATQAGARPRCPDWAPASRLVGAYVLRRGTGRRRRPPRRVRPLREAPAALRQQGTAAPTRWGERLRTAQPG